MTPMIVILSEAKDLTSLQCASYRNQVQDTRTKLVEGNLEILFPDARSLAALGMTENEAKDLTS